MMPDNHTYCTAMYVCVDSLDIMNLFIMHVYVRMYIIMYVWWYVCMYVCMYVFVLYVCVCVDCSGRDS